MGLLQGWPTVASGLVAAGTTVGDSTKATLLRRMPTSGAGTAGVATWLVPAGAVVIVAGPDGVATGAASAGLVAGPQGFATGADLLAGGSCEG